MRIKFCLSILILLALTALMAIPAYADEAGSSINMSDFASSSGLPGAVLIQALEQPLSINQELNSVLITDHAWKFLKDLNLKLYTATTSDGTQSLGLSYTLTKDLKRFFFTKSNSLQTGISYSLNLDGNTAVIQDANPNDFLISDFSIHYFRSQGGAIQSDEALYASLNQLEDKMAGMGDLNQLLASPEYKDFAKALRKNMTDQYYIDFSAIGGYESNHSFRERQLYYGVQLGLDLKAWNPQSKLAKYNIFDWPFALIRFLSGNDNAFTPRGTAIPTVLLGLDMVDPQSGVVKKFHPDDSFFTRFRAETSFRTPLSLQNLIFFEASYRYDWQPHASELIKQNAMDRFGYFVAALTLPNGMFASYSTGKLPADLESDRVYELGFRFSL